MVGRCIRRIFAVPSLVCHSDSDRDAYVARFASYLTVLAIPWPELPSRRQSTHSLRPSRPSGAASDMALSARHRRAREQRDHSPPGIGRCNQWATSIQRMDVSTRGNCARSQSQTAARTRRWRRERREWWCALVAIWIPSRRIRRHRRSGTDAECPEPKATCIQGRSFTGPHNRSARIRNPEGRRGKQRHHAQRSAVECRRERERWLLVQIAHMCEVSPRPCDLPERPRPRRSVALVLHDALCRAPVRLFCVYQE